MNLAKPFSAAPRWTILLVAAAAAACSTKPVNPGTTRRDASAGDARDGRASVTGDAPEATDAGGGDAYVRPTVGSCATIPAVKRPMGDVCSCHEECQTGNCVDGVLCASLGNGPG